MVSWLGMRAVSFLFEAQLILHGGRIDRSFDLDLGTLAATAAGMKPIEFNAVNGGGCLHIQIDSTYIQHIESIFRSSLLSCLKHCSPPLQLRLVLVQQTMLLLTGPGKLSKWRWTLSLWLWTLCLTQLRWLSR